MKGRRVMTAVLALFAGTCMATDAGIDLGTRGDFDAQRTRVMAGLADGETYVEISPEERNEVVSALGRMDILIGTAGVDALHPADRVKLMNEQDRVNVILTRAAADSRMVCNRERVVGSRLPTTVCKTVAERRRMREDARMDLEAPGRARRNTIL